MKARTARVLCILFLLSTILVQCGTTPSTETPSPTTAPAKPTLPPATATAELPKPQGTLVRAITTFPNSLDLPQCAERQAATTAWMLYDSLVWFDDEGNIVPALAERWKVSDNGTEYTFYLRQDVTFHNGEAFSADAVVFSWERAKDNDFEYSHQWQEANLVEKIDDYTVRITTAEPNALFLGTIADAWAIIPPGYFAQVGQDGFDAHPVGTGPFMFVEWIPEDHITMQANPNYWRPGVPRIETLIFRPIPESADRVDALLKGEVDIVTRLSAEEALSLLGVEGVEVIKYPVTRIYYVAFNNVTTGLDQPTMNPQVRQAMNYAVDVQDIIDTVLEGFGQAAAGFVASSELGYDATKSFGYDPNLAGQLLTEAGYPDGFSIEMACPAGAYTHFEQVCEAIVEDLGEVGIQVSLETMDSGPYWEMEAEKQLPPLFGDSWSAVGGEAYRRLIGALGGWDSKYSAWHDEEILRLLDEIRVTVDREKRAQLYRELQTYMYEDPPFIYLYEPFTFEVINTRVQGYKPRAAETYFLFETWVQND